MELIKIFQSVYRFRNLWFPSDRLFARIEDQRNEIYPFLLTFVPAPDLLEELEPNLVLLSVTS